MKLRLLAVFQDVDFRINELNNYESIRRKKHWQGDPKPGQGYLIISRSQDQLLWVLGYSKGETTRGTPRHIIQTMRLRVRGGRWNPLMLQNYANDVGLELVGIRRYEEHLTRKRRTG